MGSSAIDLKTHPIDADNPALGRGWGLLEFLIELGADEFSLSIIYAGSPGGRELSDSLWARLEFAFTGKHMRERAYVYRSGRGFYLSEIWRLDQRSLAVLREIMPDGVIWPGFIPSGMPLAWIEDLCVYRQADLIFGVISHEREAFVRLTDEEWSRWIAL
jgi:hypothetical protein